MELYERVLAVCPFLRSYRPYFDSEPLSIIFSFDYDPRHRSPESRDGLETSIVSTRAREEEKEREKGKNDEGEIKRKKEIWEKWNGLVVVDVKKE